jgi:hypothetical protein
MLQRVVGLVTCNWGSGRVEDWRVAVVADAAWELGGGACCRELAAMVGEWARAVGGPLWDAVGALPQGRW